MKPRTPQEQAKLEEIRAWTAKLTKGQLKLYNQIDMLLRPQEHDMYVTVPEAREVFQLYIELFNHTLMMIEPDNELES
jgi:DNA-binding protein H-NS